ncbi:MAG: YncE family protein [Bacteroidales bacterium]|nr:YncE family protein [Bacteroidales bacterium]
MSFRQQLIGLFILFTTLFFTGCKPQPQPGPDGPINAGTDGIYILNEGLFQMNNCTLSYYDFESQALTDDIFTQVNNRGLGDTGNDLQRYGNKMYAVINNSNRVEIMDVKTAKSLKAISLTGKSPRHIAFYNGKAFVSCFDGDIVRIDTSTLDIDATFYSGSNPEGLCVCNGKLYVANSGGLNYPNYDNTLSVFDVNTLEMIDTVIVGKNPSKVCCDGNRIYVCCKGNYGDEAGRLLEIITSTNETYRTWNNIQNFTIFDGKAYVYDVRYKGTSDAIRVINLHNDSYDQGDCFIKDGTHIQMPYSITVNPINGDVYITDVHDFSVTGDVICFNKEGQKKFTFSAGLNPNAIVFK